MKRLSIPTLNFINSSILTVLLIVIFGALWYNTRKSDLEHVFEDNKAKVMTSSKNSVEDMVDSAINLIVSSRKTINNNLKTELKNTVLRLEGISSRLSMTLSLDESTEKFQKIFWNSIITVGQEENAFPFMINPLTLELTLPDSIKATHQDAITPNKINTQKIVDLTNIYPEGIFIDSLFKSTTYAPKFIPKKCFVKYNPDLKMVIGYSLNNNKIEESSKKQTLELINNLSFKDDEYIFVIDKNGVMLAHDNPEQIGKNLLDFRDDNDVPVIKYLINTAKANPKGGFVRYRWRRPSTGIVSDKIGFAKEIKDFNWIIGSGLYLANLDLTFAENYQDIMDSLNQNKKIIVGLLLFVIALIVIISSFISCKIKSYIVLFTTALKDSVNNRSVIDTGQMKLPELEKISLITNEILAELLIADEQLKQFTTHLEDQVKLRTQELLIKTNQLEESTKLANAANVAKSDFLANMSHEIRTPMNIILGMQQLLLDSGINNTQHNYLTKANEAATALLGIIEDILDFSKIEAGQLQIEMIEFDLEDTIYSTLSFLNFEASQKDIEIIFDYDINIPDCVLGDPLRLRQIVSNICSNAIKFTEEGNIIVSANLIENKGDELIVEFCIKDSGIGITEEKQKELFSPFKQADTSITRKYGGTGLGLIICKQLIELHGGDISLESTPNLGTTVHFTMQFNKVSYSKSPSYTISPKHQGERVLIIDNNTKALTVLSKYGDEGGFIVDAAPSLETACTYFNKRSRHDPIYHSVLINSVLSDTYGLEAFLYIKSHFPISSTNFILMTKDATPEVVKSAKDLGFDVTLKKPIAPSHLLRTLENPHDTAFTTVKILHSKNLTHHTFNDLKVLVVEDNITNQEIMTALLTKIGCKVTLANNGKEGVSAAIHNKFNLIFMDIQMPVLDGLSATREIRKHDHETPIIAMTAHAVSEDYQKSISAGMNEHITKPIKIERLYEALHKYGIKKEDKEQKEEPDVPTHTYHRQNKETYSDSNNDKIWSKLENVPQLDIQEAFTNTGEDQGLLIRIYKEYINIGSEILNSLRTAFEQKDMETVSRTAHTLKGSCGTIGATKIAEAAINLETKIKEDLADEVSTAVEELSNELSSLITALQEIFNPEDQ